MSWVDVTTAVATASAVVVALALGLKAEWRATRLEREQHEQEERRQAIHVAAWMLVEQDDGDGPGDVEVSDLSLDMRKARIYSVIQNASDEPIWDVVVNVPILVEKSKGSRELQAAETEDEVISVGPHETLKQRITVLVIPFSHLPLQIEFRDNAGRDWRRDDRGRLHRGRTSEPSFAIFDEPAREKARQKGWEKAD
jgi:hypothetical protein